LFKRDHFGHGFSNSPFQDAALESEFIALSSSFRSLIPVKRLIEETLSGLDIKTQVRYSSKSTVFEDNAGALQLATTKRLTPRTRHIATKYFWFHKHVDEDLATIVKVESSQNKSDAFTKSLKPHEFIGARKLYVDGKLNFLCREGVYRLPSRGSVTTVELVVTTVESVRDSKSERTSLLNDKIVRVKL
jgi:hypothetical protein